MSATQERGGTDATDDESQAVLSIMFSERVGDAVRALRAYGDARVADALGVDATQATDSEQEIA